MFRVGIFDWDGEIARVGYGSTLRVQVGALFMQFGNSALFVNWYIANHWGAKEAIKSGQADRIVLSSIIFYHY